MIVNRFCLVSITLLALLLTVSSTADAASQDRIGRITDLIRALAPAYRLDPNLVLAVIETESSFDPKALSPKNAQGLMQLIPKTAARFGVTDVWDPRQNLKGGMAYLRWLLDYFGGDVRLALAGYNAGEKAVKRYGGIPPYPETIGYVRTVTQAQRRYARRSTARPAAVPVSAPHDTSSANPHTVTTTAFDRRNAMQTAVISQSPEDLGTPGVRVEYTAEEAAASGAFEETALSEEAAWEASGDSDSDVAGDPHATDTAVVVNGQVRK